MAVLAPMVVLASPQGYPHGPPPHKWHQGPGDGKPTATTSTLAAGILPSSAFGAGSTGTGTPKLYHKLKADVSGVVSGVAGAGSTGTPNVAGDGEGASVPAASASVSLTSYD